MNAPLHCLGIHDNCLEYFCTKTSTIEARERVSLLKKDLLYYEILGLCQHYFANKAKSLLAGYDNNVVEGFNSLIAKTTGKEFRDLYRISEPELPNFDQSNVKVNFCLH